MRIYTRTGDEGETGLFGGGRVAKDHPRVAAYGDVDELNSVLGLARGLPPAELFDLELEAIQRDLFAIGGHLATPDPAKVRAALAKATRSCRRCAPSSCRPAISRRRRCISPGRCVAGPSAAW